MRSQNQLHPSSTSWRGPAQSGPSPRASCPSSGSAWTSLARGALGCRRFSTRDVPCSVLPTSPPVFSVTSQPTTGNRPGYMYRRTMALRLDINRAVTCHGSGVAVVSQRTGQFRGHDSKCQSERVTGPLHHRNCWLVFFCPEYHLATLALQKPKTDTSLWQEVLRGLSCMLPQ